MKLNDALNLTSIGANPEPLSTFEQHVDPVWIDQALEATGTASLRKRRLPAEQVVWLVLGMALFRHRPMTEVVDKLDLTLPSPSSTTVGSSAIAQARQRLGEEPMAWLFNHTADHWTFASADKHRWRGLALYGLDGSSLAMPDTPENASHFGYPSTGRAESAFPQLRLVALMALRSHLLAAVEFGPFEQSEYALASALWGELPDDSLVVVDKYFFSADLLLSLQASGNNRHWLIRAKKSAKWTVDKKLGPKDFIVTMNVSNVARSKNPMLPKTWTARAIGYTIDGKEFWILTSLMDATSYPADELVELYAERWEIEQGYDELKTEMLDGEPTLRSKSPEAVRQEVWGLLLTYNLIRLEIERIAVEAEVEPTRISFVTSMRFIQDEWLWCAVASPGAIPKHLKRLREDIKRFILPPRRKRSYRREVKVKMSSYPRKRRSRTA